LSKKESRVKSRDDYDTFPYPPGAEEETERRRKERLRWNSLSPYQQQKELERRAQRSKVFDAYEYEVEDELDL
jgi:hypothetical protein